LQRGLFTLSAQLDWRLEAWAVFSNHYHFVAHSPETGQTAETLTQLLRILHVPTAEWVNKLDGTPGRWRDFGYAFTPARE
jgi:putative transposase